MLDKNLFDRAGVLNFLDVPAMYKFQIIIHIMYLAFRLFVRNKISKIEAMDKYSLKVD